MTDIAIQQRNAVQSMADGMRTVFFLSLLTNAFEMYRFAVEPGDLRQGLSSALGLPGTALIWLLGRQLRAGKKQALNSWLGAALLGYTRFIFIDGTFELNILTMVVLCLAIGLTMRMILWVRHGLLA